MSQVVSFQGYTPPARYDDEPFTSAEVEEATVPDGPWALIDTLTLTPVDADPSAPTRRNLTTTLASDTPGLWYRLTFVDDDGDRSLPTDPIRNLAGASQFATSDDFAARLGLTLSDDEAFRVETLLSLASDLIRDEAQQQLSLAEEIITIPGTTDEMIKLPQRPVVAVSSVTLDGVPLLEGGDWYRDGNTIVRRRTSVSVLAGTLDVLALGHGFGWPAQTLEITYTHGYADLPASLKAICLEAAVRVWVNPGSVAQEREGETSTLYHYASSSSDAAGLLLTHAEQQVIRRLVGRPAKSITIGR